MTKCTTLAGLALAAAAPGASAQFIPVTLEIRADATTAAIGDTITWTVSVSWPVQGGGPWEYLGAYDLSFLASDDGVALASPFQDALNPILNPGPGTPSGASILGAFGGQSSILGNVNYATDIVIGSFQTLATAEGTLTYTVADGGQLGVDHLRVNYTDFGPAELGPPDTLLADTVTITPAPGAAAALSLAALTAARRRRAAHTHP